MDERGGVDSDTITVTVTEPPNQVPIAIATATPANGFAPLSVQLDASTSFDTDGSITSYTWDWGTGSATGASVAEVFQVGTYQVTLTVMDNEGAFSTDMVTITSLGANTDTDGDGIFDSNDNCPTVPNPNQNLFTFYEDEMLTVMALEMLV